MPTSHDSQRPIALYIPFASGSLADEAVIKGTVGFGEVIGTPARVHLHNARRRWRCPGAEDHYVHHRRWLGISRRDIRRGLRKGRPSHILILMNDTFDGHWGISHTRFALTVGQVALEEGVSPIICNVSVKDEASPAFAAAVADLSDGLHLVARDVRSAATLSALTGRTIAAVPDIATFMQPSPSADGTRVDDDVVLVPNQHQAAMLDDGSRPLDRYLTIALGLADSGRHVIVMPHDMRSHVGDERLATEVVEAAGSPSVTLYRPGATADAKAAVARAGGLVAGRLHACLAGLSTGTPTVGLDYMGKFAMQFAWWQVEGNALDFRELRTRGDVADLVVPRLASAPVPVPLSAYQPLIDLLPAPPSGR